MKILAVKSIALTVFASSLFALLTACPPTPQVPQGPPPEYEEPDAGTPPAPPAQTAAPTHDTQMSLSKPVAPDASAPLPP